MYHLLTDERMVRLQPFFAKNHGHPHGGDRRVLRGIIFVNRNDLRWRAAGIRFTQDAVKSLETMGLCPDDGGPFHREDGSSDYHD